MNTTARGGGPDNGPSIGLVCNIYNDAKALPGLLECASRFFDDLLFYHAGPGGERSTDGTIETLEAWGARIIYDSIDDGFGAVRTRAVHASDCEWVMILDADERFHALAPTLACEEVAVNAPGGTALTVREVMPPYDQGSLLRGIIADPDIDAVLTCRRHWHDLTWTRPTQNWCVIPDAQLRIVRNCEHVVYATETRMHEHCRDTRTGRDPRHYNANTLRGPFHDHYHLFFKAMEPDQRKHDIAIYDAIHEGRKPPTWEEFGRREDVNRVMDGIGARIEKLAGL